MTEKLLKFPKNFYWGAATSAYQVEGNNINDWSEWEKSESRIQNLESRIKNPNFRKQFSEHLFEKWPTPLDLDNYISGRACDHYNRFKEDFDIAKSLGHNSHRFSIEWSRVEPEEGKFDEKEIEHYRKVILALKERGIEPFVTLWHWTHPLWFYRRGAWLHPKAEESFLRFVEKVVSEYKNEVRYWITLNEPETYVRHGYIQAIRPPQTRNIFKAFKVIRKFAQIHKNTHKLIHNIYSGKDVMVGFSEGLVFFDVYNRWPHNLLLKYILEWWRNKQFAPKVANACDFIGLNYYLHSRVRLNPFVSWKWFQHNENKYGVSDMGWELYPEGIFHILEDLKKYNKPIYITENGLADAQDTKREKFIKSHLFWVTKAISEGVDVRGYFHWSFLDNFEWTDGFWLRFGLVEIDYKTMERKIRKSALAYAEICKSNEINI